MPQQPGQVFRGYDAQGNEVYGPPLTPLPAPTGAGRAGGAGPVRGAAGGPVGGSVTLPEKPKRKVDLVGATIDALPSGLGMVGGGVGAAGGTIFGLGFGGVPGAVGGAAVGGMTGESLRQHLRRLTGRSAPPTMADAAANITQAGVEQGAAEAVGQGVGAALRGGAKLFMKAALGNQTRVLNEFRTTQPKLAETLLNEGVNVTPNGIRKLGRILEKQEQKIAETAAQTTGAVRPGVVAQTARATRQEMLHQVNPKADMEAAQASIDEFLKHPSINPSGKAVRDMTAAQAQEMKVGTYKRLAGKFGEMKSAQVETEKALARGLKEELERLNPAFTTQNKRAADLMAGLDAISQRYSKAAGQDPVGIGWVAQNPAVALAFVTQKSPMVKSFIANRMWDAAGKAAGVSANTIRFLVYALASEPGDEQ